MKKKKMCKQGFFWSAVYTVCFVLGLVGGRVFATDCTGGNCCHSDVCDVVALTYPEPYNGEPPRRGITIEIAPPRRLPPTPPPRWVPVRPAPPRPIGPPPRPVPPPPRW